MTGTKLILVIGATGAQGLAVIDALLAPSADGSPSPYTVRALTRDPESRRALELRSKGVECFKGSFEDFPSVLEALKGAYGAWVNTDGFTVGERREVFAGMRIFELAKQVGTVRHYVWSNLDYITKLSGYDPAYRCEHYDGKGRVAEWMKAQPSDASNDGMAWSIVTTGPYMNMLNNAMFGAITQRHDGTHVFASPIGSGHVPMIALTDLGFFARYSFDNRQRVSGEDLEVASQMVGWDELVQTFQRVAGEKAVYVKQSVDEWFDNFKGTDQPVAWEGSKESTSWKKNFTGWWSMFRDDIVKRDMEWIRQVNPQGHTLESWMRETGYKARKDRNLLKGTEDHPFLSLNGDKVYRL